MSTVVDLLEVRTCWIVEVVLQTLLDRRIRSVTPPCASSTRQPKRNVRSRP
jgi:hypothetical protein